MGNGTQTRGYEVLRVVGVETGVVQREFFRAQREMAGEEGGGDLDSRALWAERARDSARDNHPVKAREGRRVHTLFRLPGGAVWFPSGAKPWERAGCQVRSGPGDLNYIVEPARKSDLVFSRARGVLV